MDIESDEWKCLPQMLSDGTLKKYLKQLDVEFHLSHDEPDLLRRQYGIAMWLDRQGFKIANLHRNIYTLTIATKLLSSIQILLNYLFGLKIENMHKNDVL